MPPNGKCPACGARIETKPGERTPVHAKEGTQKMCQGGITKPL
jgi:hypothetical protein